ncbi:RHS repeat domain-containing protein [Taibaiella soli]|uniref:RHS repeat-associated core domain-containing protein n=1 Tax=Taibaiella soli TaxID=1649169 RepID=A0A2W2C4G3_9BACT|nr:RHS repeat-associated core domain-containing protein [Taibaiella soli]PZF75033.1 hypothetical protein DN068_00320 [Taibaiella soli]
MIKPLSYNTDSFFYAFLFKHPLSEDEGWIGTGRTIYNNKGNVVMQFEPYFSSTHLCDTAAQAASQGVSPRMHYDPLSRVQRVDMPDGTFSKTEWTSWQQTSYDANDTVKDSDWYAAILALSTTDLNLTQADIADIQKRKDTAAKAVVHYNTPTVVHLDALARPFYTIASPGPFGGGVMDIHSYVVLDILGNRLAVVDGLGRTQLQYRYNMLKQVCYQHSIDSADSYTLTDVAGQPLYAWDAEKRRFTVAHDVLRRPAQKKLALYNSTTQDWHTDTVLEITNYGESAANAITLNLRGQVYEHFDSSGKTSMPLGYDFKGQPLQTALQLIADRTVTDTDWNTNPTLSTETFTTTIQADALGRPVTLTDAGGNQTQHVYDRGGALKTVRLNGDSYVNDIHYDAKGQRQAIWYGNGTKTSYVYDSLTYRLTRLLTVNVNTASTHYNEILQDLNYYYDPVGNIAFIRDDAQQTIFFKNSVVSPDQDFTYDALYRLIQAQGRELTSLATLGSSDNYNDSDHITTQKGNGSAVQNYMQTYEYDAVGNIKTLTHAAAAAGYTRTYQYGSGSNQLLSTKVNGQTFDYSHDARGNMITMPHLQQMQFNGLNELHYTSSSFGGGQVEASYQYSGGQRIRKYVQKSGIAEERIYLGSFELYRKYDNGTLTLERSTVHVSDDTGRIAMLEQRNPNYTDSNAATLQRYIYSNHLGSAALELDESAAVISYEEYHPYGTTAYQATDATINAVAKRYRFTGKERDEESGLYYHGARYYIPWLARWSACDPLEGKYAPLSCYNYGFNNPITWTDPTGMGPNDKKIQYTEQPTTGVREKHSDSGYTGVPAPDVHLPEVVIHGGFAPSGGDTMRSVTEDEMHGYNLWYYMKNGNSEISIPTHIVDAVANPASRFLQQVTSGITGQKTVHNLDGTDAWQTNVQVGAGGNVSPVDAGNTGLMIALEGLPQVKNSAATDLVKTESKQTSANAVTQTTIETTTQQAIPAAETLRSELGILKNSARTLSKDEDILITPAEGLQSSHSGKFENVTLGTKGDKATTYLWTIDERGLNVALEKTPMTTDRGNIVHSNISSKAYIAGEAWFESENTVIINAGSGRFGDGNPLVNEKTWEAAQQFWKSLGYEVKAIPFKTR